MRLRKKPVVIDGFHMTAARMQSVPLEGFPLWAFTAVHIPAPTPGALYRMTDTVWCVHTVAGVMRVDVDDWVLRGVDGELYPCKPDVLALTYDVVGPDKEGT